MFSLVAFVDVNDDDNDDDNDDVNSTWKLNIIRSFVDDHTSTIISRIIYLDEYKKVILISCIIPFN